VSCTERPSGRDTGRPLARLPAPGLLRFRREDLPRAVTLAAARRATFSGRRMSGPTKPLAQRHGRIESMRTSWQKTREPGLLFNCVGGHLLEPILTQTAHFLVPLQRLKSLNHHPQWRVGNFGENYHAETIHYSRCGQKPCALTTRRSRSVRSRRLVAGRCSEQLGTKRAARRILMRRHRARRNLGLLRNSLAGWSALRRNASSWIEGSEPDGNGTRLRARWC
jgi:hypothetical protein